MIEVHKSKNIEILAETYRTFMFVFSQKIWKNNLFP